jgi:hypothetical protein
LKVALEQIDELAAADTDLCSHDNSLSPLSREISGTLLIRFHRLAIRNAFFSVASPSVTSGHADQSLLGATGGPRQRPDRESLNQLFVDFI